MLIGELIVYPCSRVRRRRCRRRPPFSNVFSSETAWPIKAKFNLEPPWDGGTKVSIMPEITINFTIYNILKRKSFATVLYPFFLQYGPCEGILMIISYVPAQ